MSSAPDGFSQNAEEHTESGDPAVETAVETAEEREPATATHLAPDPASLPGAAEEAEAEAALLARPPAESFTPETVAPTDVAVEEQPLFANYEYAPAPLPRRKPDFADFLLFAVLAFGASLCSGVVVLAALHYHVLGAHTFKQANDDIHYRIGSQAAWYILTLLFSVWIFPLAWRKSFFAGLEWRAAAATRHIWRLVGAASACFIGAMADQFLMPGPTNTPIDETFRMPGAVWLLFAFGVTLAPLMEEIAYRGFLLPACCTTFDWTMERLTKKAPLPLDEDGFPRWSAPAMIFASVLVSIPFALMHGEQTAYSIGPFLLLVAISLVLCWVRLAMRSLAASVLVHSTYNLLLFSLMFLGTGGFRHLDNM